MTILEEESILEIMEIYLELVEKQDEIISKMSKIIARQAMEIKLLQNDRCYSDREIEEIKGTIEYYNDLKRKIEP